MKTNRFKVWLPLLFSIVMIVGMFLGYKMRDAMPGKSFFYTEKRSTVQEITDLLNNRYVDSINTKAINDTVIESIIAMLDPHSSYIPQTELQQINDEIKGSFFGLGIEYNILNDSLNVVQVLAGSPSQKAGLQTGDVILKADDSIISGIKLPIEKIRTLLRGPDGSSVKLSLLRNQKKQTVEVTRGSIPIKSVDVAYMLDPTTGYMRLNRFSSQTYKEFMNNLLALKKLNMKSLVLDLRGNGGGVLDEATEIADEFLEGDKLITYTEGLHAQKKEYRCRRQGQFEDGKLVLLADEGTASASEVLLGALQDWDRGIIVGRRSFGKGLVQEQYNLSDGSALRLTVARYFTPIGRSIQRSYKNGNKSYYNDVLKRFTDGEVVTADSVKNDTTKIYKSKAGKKLYGSGGISPDYFVASDTGKLNKITARIYTRGTLSDFGYQYFKANNDSLKMYKTAESFITNFSVGEKEWTFFKNLAVKDSVDVKLITNTDRVYIEKILKASLARQLFSSEGFYRSQNISDDFIKKALELIK